MNKEDLLLKIGLNINKIAMLVDDATLKEIKPFLLIISESVNKLAEGGEDNAKQRKIQ